MALSSFRALVWKSAIACMICGCATQSASALKLAYTVGSDGLCDYHDLNSAIAAVKQNPNPNRIFVAVNAGAPTSSIAIADVNLSIQGGFSNCGDMNEPSSHTTIDGSGNGGHSVFSITGNSNVTLYNLTITGGNAGGSDGGGIYFSGTGSLTLSATTVQINHASNGGGIEMDAQSGGASLFLGANVFVSGNVASASGDTSGGGGIRLTGPSTLTMNEDAAQIANNHADSGKGGGVLVIGPATAYLGSPGVGSAGAIYGNRAQDGGGAAAVATDGSPASLFLFTTDPSRPGRISNNSAFGNGGAVYLKSYSPTFGDGTLGLLCGWGFRIDTNTASEGTAIYTQYDGAIGGDEPALAYLSTDKTFLDTYCPNNLNANGAKQCTAATCNLVDTNNANDIGNDNAPTAGATFYLNDDGGYECADFAGVKIQNNTGGYVFHGNGSLYGSAMLITNNHLQRELINLDGSAFINSMTLANDEINSQYVISIGTNLSFKDSIIDEEGTKSLHFTGDSADLEIADILSNDTSTLPADSSIVQGDPMFFDLPHGDYRLRATQSGSTISASPAIDFAPPISGDDRDVEDRPYDQDELSIPNRSPGSVRDLGAYEMQPITDRIFADAFGDPITIVY